MSCFFARSTLHQLGRGLRGASWWGVVVGRRGGASWWGVARFCAQGTGVVGRIVVDDIETPFVTAALAGGRLAFQGLFPDALALGLGHVDEEREQGGAAPGRVVDPLERAG
ncbi:hypothetical protein OG244_03445 [Streptomyces brevispora]|uniref:hypothetical protein n=1 Tax=Streptomyces brevispora TaxID=887462 RepID=UPI002E34811A|nr:hypothetical protein [Streptomyces brevispora]